MPGHILFVNNLSRKFAYLYCQQYQKIVKIHPKMVVEIALFITQFAEWQPLVNGEKTKGNAISDTKTTDYHLIIIVDDSPIFLVNKLKRILTIHDKTSEIYTLFIAEIAGKRSRHIGENNEMKMTSEISNMKTPDAHWIVELNYSFTFPFNKIKTILTILWKTSEIGLCAWGEHGGKTAPVVNND